MLKLQFSNGAAPETGLEQPRITIGRDPKNDIVLDQAGVSGFHAEIQTDQGKAYLIDMGSTNGTFVNDTQISGRHLLKAWDRICFDKVAGEVTDTEGRRPTQVNRAIRDEDLDGTAGKTQVRPTVGSNATQIFKAPSQRLAVISGALAGKSFDLEKESITLGREEDCDIVLADSTVSARHAVVREVQGRIRIEDLGSSNGTYINGNKIQAKDLLSGDTVRLGKVELRLDGQGRANKTKVMSASTTRIMPEADDPFDETRTLHQKAAGGKKGLPAWALGVIAFVVVGGAALGFLATQNKLPAVIPGSAPKAVTAKLQGYAVWTRQLSGNRTDPATPVLADINDDTYLDVILGDASGFVTALDGQKGLKIFEVETADRILAPAVAGDLTGDGAADVVVASRSGEVTAMNGEGRILWASSRDLGLGPIVNRPVLADVTGDGKVDVIVPTAKKGIVALDGTRGWKLWDTAGVFKSDVVTSPVALDVNDDGIMDFIGATSGGQAAAVCGQGEKAWVIWEAAIPNVNYASPMVYEAGDTKVAVFATDKGTVALNAGSGRTLWQVAMGAGVLASPVGVEASGDRIMDVALVTKNGGVHVLDGLTGDEIWSAGLNTQVIASPALFDCTNDGLKDLIVLDAGGNINVLDMAKGRVVLQTRIGQSDAFVSSPILGDLIRDQMLEVVTAAKNGAITAFGLNRSLKIGDAPWPMFLGNNTHVSE